MSVIFVKSRSGILINAAHVVCVHTNNEAELSDETRCTLVADWYQAENVTTVGDEEAVRAIQYLEAEIRQVRINR